MKYDFNLPKLMKTRVTSLAHTLHNVCLEVRAHYQDQLIVGIGKNKKF